MLPFDKFRFSDQGGDDLNFLLRYIDIASYINKLLNILPISLTSYNTLLAHNKIFFKRGPRTYFLVFYLDF